MTVVFPVPDQLIEQVAALVAEIVLDRLPKGAGERWHLLNVEEAATRLGRSTRWVRDHKDEIGWVRLDGGALAFDLEDLRRFAYERRIACDPLADPPRSRDF